MRIVFFGTPEFAVPSLEALLAERATIVGVVTQPDKARGRSRSTLVAPPVKRVAEAHGLPVLQPDHPRGDVFLAALRHWQPELGVVVAYGHLLRSEVLSLPSRGMINIHASLLPELRGAAPINWAIFRGYAETGVSIMQMDSGMDTGPVLRQSTTPIGINETAGELAARLATLGAETLVETLALIRLGRLSPEPQDGARATVAPKIERQVARIDWTEPAEAVSRRIRAFDPAPGAWPSWQGGVVKCFGPAPVAGDSGTRAGCGHGTVDGGDGKRAARNRGGSARRTGPDDRGGMVSRPGTGDGRAVRVKLPRVFGVTTDAICRAADFAGRVSGLGLAGPGLGLVIRAPGSTAADHAASVATALERSHPSMVFVHGRPDLAAASGAGGVQLRRSDLSPADARTVFPKGWIGVSVHDLGEAEAALAEGADYLVAGSVFESSSHPGRPGRGLEWLESIATLGSPVIAIGGMTLARIPAVRNAGAWGIAVISAIWDQPDPRSAAAALLSAWSEDLEIGVVVNGEARRIPTPATLATLLAHLELDARAVVVELNRKVIRRPALSETALHEGDAVEVVHFVGGG